MIGLNEATDFIMGQAPHSSTYNEYGKGDLLIKAGDFGTLYPSPKTYTTAPIAHSKKGDVIICVVGATSGKVNLGINASITRSIAALRPKEFTDMKYLYYLLKGSYRELNRAATGSAQGILNKTALSKFKIPLPPLETQKKIAAILDEADKLRQLDKQLIEKYDALTQALFLDMFGDPVSNPKGWEKLKFNTICSFDKISVKPEDILDDTYYVGLESIEKETGQILEKVTVKSNELKSNKFWFDSNYILYGKLRPYLNKVAAPTFEGVCSTDIIPMKAKENKTNKQFIISIMRNNGFVAFANERSSGANLPRISPKEIEKYMVINPPIEHQKKYAERVQLIEAQKAQANQSLLKSEELFNSLLKKAFKGELVE